MFRFVGERLKRVFEWKEFIPSAVWTEANRRLVSESSAKTGNMNLAYTPHLREMFADIDSQDVFLITLKSASQIAKTEFIFSFLLYKIATDPSPIMCMIPTAGEEINRYMKNKFDPALKGCDVVKDMIIEHKEVEKIRLKSTQKMFSGGSLTFLSSHKPKSLSIKYAVFDEVAEFENGAVNEALERLKTFKKYGAKAIIASTQNNQHDEINFYFNTAEVKKQFYHVCNKCGTGFYPDFTTFKIPSVEDYKVAHKINRDLSEHEIVSEYKFWASYRATMECPSCLNQIDDKQRVHNILNGNVKWVQVVKEYADPKDSSTGVWVEAKEPKKTYETVGYDINSFNSYFVTLQDMAKLIIDAEFAIKTQADYSQMDKFYRGYLNKIYSKNVVKSDHNNILRLGNGYRKWEVPNDTIALYMGVDTQKDHFWFEIKAYCYGYVSHSVAHGKIYDINQLEELLTTPYSDRTGKKHYIRRMGIDRLGSRTSTIDAWARDMIVRYGGVTDWIYTVMGENDNRSKLPFRISTLEKNITNNEYDPVSIQNIWTNNTVLKNTLMSSIDRTIAKVNGTDDYENLLFYINEDIVDEANTKEKSTSADYERQYTSEHKEIQVVGKTKETKEIWVKNSSSVDNHLLDCGVICTAFAELDHVFNQKKPVESNNKDLLNRFIGLNS